MRRLLFLLPFGAAVGLWAFLPRATGQAPDVEFGVLRTTPAAPVSGGGPVRSVPGLPAGVQPATPGGTSARPSAPNPFPLAADAGSWLICAAHYVGFDGASLAEQVARELRQRHRLNAYIFNRGDEERRRQDEQWERYKAKFPPGTPLRRRGVRIQDQYAVLVGPFKDFAAASAYLPKVRGLPMPQLKLQGDASPYDTIRSKETDPKTGKTVLRQVPLNPFWNAMVVRNPLTGGGEVGRPKWDPLYEKLNAGEEYSLLKNKKPWTLAVKAYFGGQVIQSSMDGSTAKPRGGILGALGFDSLKGESLAAAASQAHELAKFLRRREFGFEAYVLHGRTCSVVTVGGFQGPNDPELERVQRQLAAMRFSADQNASQTDPIGLQKPAVPVEVPHP
jgi:hypothetical protein